MFSSLMRKKSDSFIPLRNVDACNRATATLKPVRLLWIHTRKALFPIIHPSSLISHTSSTFCLQRCDTRVLFPPTLILHPTTNSHLSLEMFCLWRPDRPAHFSLGVFVSGLFSFLRPWISHHLPDVRPVFNPNIIHS